MAVLHEYLWLVVVGAFVAFGFGWGTGANDVANAFGTSVGSRTLTLKQAVIIAAIFEFAGALLLGRVSTNVIAGGIADQAAFAGAPAVYAWGMVCALGVGTIWLIVTSYLGLNVSSTHSIIGGILGFALVWAGKDGVIWAVRDNGAFPPYKGMVSICMAWFIAPILTGACAALFFFVLRTCVLRRKNAFAMSFWLLPFLVLCTVWTCLYFVFTKGAKKSLSSSDWTDAKAAWVSVVIAAGCALLAAVVGMPLLRWKSAQHFDSEGKRIKATRISEPTTSPAATELVVKEGDQVPTGALKDLEGGELNKMAPGATDAAVAAVAPGNKVPGKGLAGKMLKMGTHGLNVDIHHAVQKDAKLAAIHENAEVYEERVEHAFSYLQVFSACCVIFAHGAGEVGYMAGPLATIWDVYSQGVLNKSVKPQIWVLLIGAIGLVIGLATYGYNVTRAMGVKLAKLTPSRGFCAELATAAIIMIAAQYGLPTSSSQCITGAIVGVGILEGTGGVNWVQFGKQFASWVCTLFIVGFGVAGIFALGVYTPSKPDWEALQVYRSQVTNVTNTMYKNFNTSLVQYQAASGSNSLNRLTPAQWQSLYKSVNASIANVTNYASASKKQTVRPDELLYNLYKALALYQQNAVFSLGQQTVYAGNNICNSPSLNSTQFACPAPKLLPSVYNTSYP